MKIEEVINALNDIRAEFFSGFETEDMELFETEEDITGRKVIDIAVKSLETIQKIDDVLNTEGMTEIDALDEIVEAVSEFKYDCEVDGEC